MAFPKESGRNHPMNDAAPYYTEDLVSHDFQEVHSASLPRENRQVQYPIRKSEERAQNEMMYRQETREISELKEKCAYLDTQLHNCRIKLNLLEKEYEKSQEEANFALSERRNPIYEMEIQRLQNELIMKNKQNESLEKLLKSEKQRYNQDISEMRILMKQCKELSLQPSQPTLPSPEKNQVNIEELLELREENHQLKMHISLLENEKEELTQKYAEELEAQYNYFHQQFEDRQNSDSPNVITPKSTSKHFDKSSSVHSEKYSDNIPQTLFDAPTESITTPLNDLVKAEDVFNPIEKNVDVSIKDEKVEDLSENSDFKEEKSDKDQESLEKPGGIQDFFTTEVKNSDFNMWFDSGQGIETTDDFFQKHENDDNKIAGLFASNYEEPERTKSPNDWMQPEEVRLNSYTNVEEEPLNSAEDFFGNLKDQAGDKFQGIPSSLFD